MIVNAWYWAWEAIGPFETEEAAWEYVRWDAEDEGEDETPDGVHVLKLAPPFRGEGGSGVREPRHPAPLDSPAQRRPSYAETLQEQAGAGLPLGTFWPPGDPRRTQG